jgi:hypothetical protein
MTETEREKQYRNYIEGFYPIAIKVLSTHPVELSEFKKFWKEKDYRKAYMPFMLLRDKTKLSEAELKIDKEFFGLFVN